MIAAVHFLVCVVWDYFKFIYCVPSCNCGGQRTTFQSKLSPPAFTWAPRIEFRSPGLHSKHIYVLNHLTGRVLGGLLACLHVLLKRGPIQRVQVNCKLLIPMPQPSPTPSTGILAYTNT